MAVRLYMTVIAKDKNKEIIYAIKNGQDTLALNFLYASTLPHIIKFVSQNNGDEDEAKDIFQDALLVFYKYVKTNRFDEKYAIGAFLRTVSRNLWINQVNKESRNSAISDKETEIPFEGNAEIELISQEREAKILELFSKLGERCKDLLVLTIFHQFSMKDVCERLGFSTEDAAKTKNYKCKQRLLEQIGDRHNLQNLLR